MITKKEYEKLLTIFNEKIGARKSELNYYNPYQFAVAVLLSAQTTDKQVNIATKDLFEIVDNPKSMLELGETELKKYIKSIGLFNSKAKHIIEMSETLVEKFNGVLPKTREELMELSGIGRKSANVILNELYGTPTIGVDTHVMRLTHRLDLVPEDATTPEQIEMALDKITPEKYKPLISNFLVLYGRYECKAQNPKCETCYIKEFCKNKEYRKSK
ncbi:MAG: endonuclease III [Alphaproteobacteria bacterium]